MLAAVVVGSGAGVAFTYPALTAADPLILAALGVVTLLSIVGFGLILPAEIKIYREVASGDPDVDEVGRLGMRNAKLGGIQGLLQLAIIFVMASLRFGP